MYKVKEIFKTLQGEGMNTGRVAVFCRFTGCNLWSGIETKRSSAMCKFCDTDFIGTDGENGGKYTVKQLADTITNIWGTSLENRFVVLTGGEPMLQVDETLIDELHRNQFYVSIETNGTIPVPSNIDHICVSPKVLGKLKQLQGQELKLVYPDVIDPQVLESLSFDRFYLQPKDDVNGAFNTKVTVDYCRDNPKWRLSLQTHKYLGIP